MPITLSALCRALLFGAGLVTLMLCNVHGSLEHGIPRRSFLSRRAIDGTRGRKYFDPEEEGVFDSYGSAGGQYDPYQEKTDFSDIRRNVPGEPGIDYPAYTTLPQTGFTCEGRSRGYYADEVSGCQVFHVCHDVLVSSFLCPIGSTFSQKLLTCDWWNKVDCSSSSKYIDVNRNSYQQDDDEMIRNAYAMISLQSGTDVTKDGLVDPDQTGSVIDYQRNPGRVLDYSLVDTTGNDLRSNFEDYPRSGSRDFLPPYQLKDIKVGTSRSDQGRFYNGGKSRSPYEDSPIIRVQKINEPNYGDQRHRDIEDKYGRPNSFPNQFQPSYAPTVPTVTTTTRRYYSPTVPTTFRPSTLAYNKLDQVIDNSDYYFSRTRTESFVTPPTRVFTIDGKAGQNSRGTPLTKLKDDDYSRQESYEDDYEEYDTEEGRNERPKERFQVRVAENLNLNRTGLLNGRGTIFDGIYGRYDRNGEEEEEESADDFEIRGSIGLGQALHKSFREIAVQEQNFAKDRVKDGNRHGINYQHTLAKPETTDYPEEIKEETTEQYEENNRRNNDSHVSVSSTTPSVIESTIKASTSLQKLINSTGVKVSTERIDSDLHALKPSEKSQSKFQIKVPELTDVSTLLIKYSSLDDGVNSGSRTTELPKFRNSYSEGYTGQPTSFVKDLEVTSNYGNTEDFKASSFQSFPTTMVKPLVSSSKTWFASSNSGEVNVKNPQRGHSESSKDLIGSGGPVQSSKSEVAVTEAISARKITASTPKTIEAMEFLGEKSKHELNETSSTAVIKSSTIDFSEFPLGSVTLKSLEETERKLQGKPEDFIEASTANSLLRSIKPETLRQIEETIEKNNSPYQVILTVNRDEDLLPTEGDLISKLIAEQGRKALTLNDRTHNLEIIKSLEPEVPETTTAKELDVENNSKPVNDFSSVVDDLKKNKNYSTISLLHLMSELLKLDKVPRPFSLSDSQNSEFRSVNFNTKLGKEIATRFQENSTDSTSKASVPKLKDQILGELTEHFGEPIYRKDREPIFGLPDKERYINFQDDLPLGKANIDEELNTNDNGKSSVSSIVQTKTEATVATSTQKTALTTEPEKTVVKTEFVPSIGFSLDTDEGREEYVEAVLGGLIEPQAAESEKKETILKDKIEVESLSKKNETLERN